MLWTQRLQAAAGICWYISCLADNSLLVSSLDRVETAANDRDLDGLLDTGTTLPKNATRALHELSSFDYDVNEFPRSWNATRETKTRATTTATSTFSPKYECGEVIARWSLDEVRQVIFQIFNIVFPPDSPGDWIARLYVNSFYWYGVETRKLCASCRDFYEEYGGTVNAPEMFENYCGPESYGNDAVVSGLLQIPIDRDGNQYVTGDFKAALMMKWIQWKAEESSSEQFPRLVSELVEGVKNNTLLDDALPILSTAVGVITIIPDYIGYGESYPYYKAMHQKRLYQTSVIPLVLKAQQVVPELTSGQTTMRTSGFTLSGFSEGGYPSIACTRALQNLGYQIRLTIAGGCAFDSVTMDGIMRTYLIASKLGGDGPISHHAGFGPYIASSYSSIYNHVANTNTDQDMLNEEWRDQVLQWIRTADGGFNYGTYEIYDILYQTPEINGNVDILMNQDLITMIKQADEQGLKYFCDLAEEGKTDKICEALEDNDMRYLVEETTSPMVWCYNTGDLFIKNTPNFLSVLTNFNLFTIPIPGFQFEDDGNLNHVIGSLSCTILTYLYYASFLYRLF